jgi:hypothetical protein
MSLWVPVVAALGASLLTSLGSWGLENWRLWANDRRNAARDRRSAYVALVVAANGVLMLGQTLRALLKAQSGLTVSLAETLRLSHHMDFGALAWRMADEVRPVLSAQADVLSCGTPRAVVVATELVSAASAYLQAATAMTTTQRLSMGVVRWKPTRGQETELTSRLEAVREATVAFVAMMRDELGESPLSVGS